MLSLLGVVRRYRSRTAAHSVILQITVADGGGVGTAVAGVGPISRRHLADELGGRLDINSGPP
jgi:hypothetical protein